MPLFPFLFLPGKAPFFSFSTFLIISISAGRPLQKRHGKIKGDGFFSLFPFPFPPCYLRPHGFGKVGLRSPFFSSGNIPGHPRTKQWRSPFFFFTVACDASWRDVLLGEEKGGEMNASLLFLSFPFSPLSLFCIGPVPLVRYGRQ